jgi:uncharacterized phiE125 gp8 family phage protein
VGLSVVTGPTIEPLSLEEAKAHLRETASEQDGLIAGYILAAREFVESATQRKLITQTLDYSIDYGWPCIWDGSYTRNRIEFPLAQVASVTSVSYVDAVGATQTLSGSSYVTSINGPVPYIEPAYGVTWPTVRSQPAAVTVRFVAGTALTQVPHALLQAMRMMISHFYANREAVNVGNIITEFPLGVEALISQYRNARL